MRISVATWIPIFYGLPKLGQAQDSITVTMRVAGDSATSESESCDALFLDAVWTVVEGTCENDADADATWYYGQGNFQCKEDDANVERYTPGSGHSVYTGKLECDKFPLSVTISTCAVESNRCYLDCCDDVNMVYSNENVAKCRADGITVVRLDCVNDPGTCAGTIDLVQAKDGDRSTTSGVKLEITSEGSCPIPVPTPAPTDSPTASPTPLPSASPSFSPSAEPTNSPTGSPTGSPSEVPSHSPTASPSKAPTAAPTNFPTKFPTVTEELVKEESSDPDFPAGIISSVAVVMVVLVSAGVLFYAKRNGYDFEGMRNPLFSAEGNRGRREAEENDAIALLQEAILKKSPVSFDEAVWLKKKFGLAIPKHFAEKYS